MVMAQEPKHPHKTGASGSSDTPKDPESGEKPTLGNPDADPQRIHREYVERHFGGGEEPTPEAYERALAEWHRLPGAAQRPPSEIRGPEETDALMERRTPASADEGPASSLPTEEASTDDTNEPGEGAS